MAIKVKDHVLKKPEFEVWYWLATNSKPGPPPMKCIAGPFFSLVHAETFAVNLACRPELRNVVITTRGPNDAP